MTTLDELRRQAELDAPERAFDALALLESAVADIGREVVRARTSTGRALGVTLPTGPAARERTRWAIAEAREALDRLEAEVRA